MCFNQSEADRVDCRLGAAVHLQSLVEVLEVIAGGLRGHPEPIGDLLVGRARRRERQHLTLARRQLMWSGFRRTHLMTSTAGGSRRITRVPPKTKWRALAARRLGLNYQVGASG